MRVTASYLWVLSAASSEARFLQHIVSENHGSCSSNAECLSQGKAILPPRRQWEPTKRQTTSTPVFSQSCSNPSQTGSQTSWFPPGVNPTSYVVQVIGASGGYVNFPHMVGGGSGWNFTMTVVLDPFTPYVINVGCPGSTGSTPYDLGGSAGGGGLSLFTNVLTGEMICSGGGGGAVLGYNPNGKGGPIEYASGGDSATLENNAGSGGAGGSAATNVGETGGGGAGQGKLQRGQDGGSSTVPYTAPYPMVQGTIVGGQGGNPFNPISGIASLKGGNGGTVGGYAGGFGGYGGGGGGGAIGTGGGGGGGYSGGGAGFASIDTFRNTISSATAGGGGSSLYSFSASNVNSGPSSSIDGSIVITPVTP